MSICNLKKILLAGTALVAVSMISTHAHAQQTELTDLDIIVADDLAGLTETDPGATGVTIDSDGTGGITIGTDTTDESLIVNGDGTTVLTVNITAAAAGDGVTFADDILETTGDIVFNITNDDVTFQGNVSDSLITAGDAAADPTILITVDTANPEDIGFDAAINAVDAADVVNLTVTNTQGGANAVTFANVIGGATANTALDTITLGADTVDPLDVTFEDNVNAGAITIGTGNGANAVTSLSFGADGGTSSVTGVISGAGAGDTNNVNVVGGADVTFNSAFGANIDTITIGADATATDVTFMDAVASGNIVIGAGGTVDVNTVTLNTVNGPFTVAGTINGGNATDTNTLAVTGGDVATVTGAIGTAGGTLMDAVTLSGVGTGLTTGGALSATTITVGASTTLTAGGLVTGAVNISGAAGTVALADGIDITGTVDNTSGGAGVGVLTSASAGAGVSVISGNVGATNSLSAVNLTGTGTLTLSGTAAATTFTASAVGGTLDFDGNVTGNVNMSADAVVDLAATKTITGAVNNTSGGAGAGTLIMAGGSTITGAVGASNTLKMITLNGVGINAFSSTVNAADVDFGAAGTATFAGNVTVTNNIDFAGFAGTATFADNANFTGLIEDTTAGGAGTVNFTGSSTVVGSLGSLANDIAAVNFNGGAGELVTVSGISSAALFTVAGAGSVSFAEDITGNLAFGNVAGTATIADNKDLNGSINGTGGVVGTGIGNMVFSGTSTGITTIGDTGILDTLTLNGTSETVTTSGNVLAADTTSLNGNTLAITGTFGLGAAQTLSADITGAATNGKVTSTGAATINANSLLDLTVSSATYIPTATTFTIVDGPVAGGGVATLNAGKLTVNGVNSGAGTTVTAGIITYSQVADVDNLSILFTRAAIGTVSTTANGDAVGAVLDTIAATGYDAGDPLLNGGTSLDTLQGTLTAAGTAGEINDILEAVSPTVDGGIVTSMLDVGIMTEGVADTRLASLQAGEDGTTGMAAGVSANGASMWLQGFGQAAQQDVRGSIDGYDADTWGAAIGADTINAVGNGVVGLMFSYGNTNVDSDNINRTETDIDSYGFGLYGSFDLSMQAFLNAQVGYARNEIDQLRHDTDGVPGSGLNSSGDFSSNQYSAKLGLGRDFSADWGLTLTPNVSAAYTYLDIDGYTETGTGVNLTVDSESLSAFNLGAGLTATWKLQNADGSLLKPALRAGYTYDVIGDDIEATASFTGDPAATAFTVTGADPARSKFNAGAGVTYMTTANWDFSANYDFTAKQDYTAHTGTVRGTAHF